MASALVSAVVQEISSERKDGCEIEWARGCAFKGRLYQRVAVRALQKQLHAVSISAVPMTSPYTPPIRSPSPCLAAVDAGRGACLGSAFAECLGGRSQVSVHSTRRLPPTGWCPDPARRMQPPEKPLHLIECVVALAMLSNRKVVDMDVLYLALAFYWAGLAAPVP